MKLKILMCGLGSIGERHARLILSNFGHEIVALRSGLRQEPNALGLPEIRSWDEADAHRFDVAFITNPTHLHIQTARECARRGLHIFLEKPIDASLDGLDEVIDILQKKGLSSYVAYPFRFHPVVQELKQMLQGRKVLHAWAVCASYMPLWRSKQGRPPNYSYYKNQGGGVVLDLSHEIDYAAYLFGDVKSINGSFGRAGSVTVDSEDYADLLIQHEETVTNVHLDYFSREPRRHVEVDTEDAYFIADLRNAFIRSVKNGQAAVRNFFVGHDDMYLEQLRYFFSQIGNPEMENNLTEASRLFQKIMEFKEKHASLSHRLR